MDPHKLAQVAIEHSAALAALVMRSCDTHHSGIYLRTCDGPL